MIDAEKSRTLSERARRRRRFGLVMIVLAIAAGGFWLGHGRLASWGFVRLIGWLAPKVGVEFTFGEVQIRLFEPIAIRQFKFRVTNPPASETLATARTIRIHINSLSEIVLGSGRFIHTLEVEGVNGTFDFRRPAIIVQPMPEFSRDKQVQIADLILRFLPQIGEVSKANLVFLADGQAYTVWDASLKLSEFEPGYFNVPYAKLEGGSIRQEIVNGLGITAWKDGAAYVSDVKVRQDITIDQFVANFVHLGGVSLATDITAYGGTVRGNVAFGAKNDLPFVDATVTVLSLPVEPLPGILALPGKATGMIQDARFTFRGNPDRLADAEIALRFSAHDFLWNARGWQSLVVSANMIGRKLYVSDFLLQQSDNRIRATGEIAIPERLETIAKSRFLLNLSADVQNLKDLAALAGPAFEGIGGRLTLEGSLHGENQRADGFLRANAADVVVSGLPPLTATLAATIQSNEVRVDQGEAWCGADHLSARGSIGLAKPHTYAGELEAEIKDIGLYTPRFGEAVARNVFAGAAALKWQGDGTQAAHSGAFHIALQNVITAKTPTGLTGDFTGTYSPENIYFSQIKLQHGPLDLTTRLTLSKAGVNVVDLTLSGAARKLLDVEAFIPVNVFSLGAGKPLGDAIDQQKVAYLSARSVPMSVADLAQLVGQQPRLRGSLQIDLEAAGPIPQLSLVGSVQGRDLAVMSGDVAMLPAKLDLKLATANGKAIVDGSLAARGLDPVRLRAEMPFSFERLPDRGLRWFKPDAPIQASADFPQTGLEIFRPMLPKVRRLSGTLTGALSVTGTLEAPNLAGRLDLTGGEFEVSQATPRISAVTGVLRLENRRAALDFLKGDVAAGPFQITGAVDLADPQNPQFSFEAKGQKILLARTPAIRLRADIDLRGEGDSKNGSVTGFVALQDGRMYKRLEITPLIVPSPLEQDVFVAPNLAGLVPPPFSAWSIDVSVRNATPFLLTGNLATGEISPDLHIQGTLGNPYATGTVLLRDVQAFLPFTTLNIREGAITFSPANPFMPVLDVRGTAEAAGYSIQAYAFGPLSDQKLVLRSDPPLSQEQLLLLLTTGLTPGTMSGAGFGEAAAGQGSLFLLRGLARQVEPFGIDLGSVINRLTIGVTPPKDPTQSAALASEIRLIDGFSIGSGRDGYGFYNAGLIYTFRFR